MEILIVKCNLKASLCLYLALALKDEQIKKFTHQREFSLAMASGRVEFSSRAVCMCNVSMDGKLITNMMV